MNRLTTCTCRTNTIFVLWGESTRNTRKESCVSLFRNVEVHLAHVHRGHAEAVQLSSVCADGESLLCRTDAHGVNLLAFSQGELIAGWV